MSTGIIAIAAALAIAISKKNIIRQDYCGTCFAVCFQTPVNMLKEVQLLIACRESKVITCCTLSAFFSTERRVS